MLIRKTLQEGKTDIDEIKVRFTKKDKSLFVILLGVPNEGNITIKNLDIVKDSKIELLGYEQEVNWKEENGNIIIFIPPHMVLKNAISFKITPQP